MNKIVFNDLYQFNYLSDVVLSPDGAHAVFTKTNTVEDKNGYTSELWIIDTASGAYKRLTTGGDERSAFWLDNSTVVFSTGRDKNPDKKSSVWFRIAIDGGEAEKYLEIEEKISSIKVLGGGKYLVTSSQNCEGKPEEKPNLILFSSSSVDISSHIIISGERLLTAISIPSDFL